MNELGKRVMGEITSTGDFGLYLNAATDAAADRYSKGVKRLCELDQNFASAATAASRRFYAGDYGTAYDYDETPIPGRENGAYETDWGVIEVKREGAAGLTTIYMDWER